MYLSLDVFISTCHCVFFLRWLFCSCVPGKVKDESHIWQKGRFGEELGSFTDDKYTQTHTHIHTHTHTHLHTHTYTATHIPTHTDTHTHTHTHTHTCSVSIIEIV